jgi:hypothetical protein
MPTAIERLSRRSEAFLRRGDGRANRFARQLRRQQLRVFRPHRPRARGAGGELLPGVSRYQA